MGRKRLTAMAAVALLAVGTACSETGTVGPAGSEESLSDGEAQFLAIEGDVLLDGLIREELAAENASVVPSNGAFSASAAPVVKEFSFTRTRPCPISGEIVVEGTGIHTIDREIATVETTFEGTKTIDRCSRRRGDVQITLVGGGVFDGYRKKVNGVYEGLQVTNQSGEFTYETSDGRSGACEYRLESVFDPSTGTLTITGHVCDKEIDRVIDVDRRADG